MHLSDHECSTLQALLHGPGRYGDYVSIETLERAISDLDREQIDDALHSLQEKLLVRCDAERARAQVDVR